VFDDVIALIDVRTTLVRLAIRRLGYGFISTLTFVHTC
jgi:hypothetical protein